MGRGEDVTFLGTRWATPYYHRSSGGQYRSQWVGHFLVSVEDRLSVQNRDDWTKYSVHAFGIQAVVVDPYTPGAIDTGEGFWILIVDSVNLDLGTFQTDANGLGGVKGVAKLPAGYSYSVWTVVSNSDDPNGFLV